MLWQQFLLMFSDNAAQDGHTMPNKGAGSHVQQLEHVPIGIWRLISTCGW